MKWYASLPRKKVMMERKNLYELLFDIEKQLLHPVQAFRDGGRHYTVVNARTAEEVGTARFYSVPPGEFSRKSQEAI